MLDRIIINYKIRMVKENVVFNQMKKEEASNHFTKKMYSNEK